MAPLEKILTGILNNMQPDDLEHIKDVKSVHNACQQNSNYGNGYECNNNQDSKNCGLENIIKDAIIQWLSTPQAQTIIQNVVEKIVQNQISIPVDYVIQEMNKKLSGDALEQIIKKIIKSNI